ncbi:MAG: hypothetical protein IE922_12630 [Sphingomonadales bacterium]|nr:hypothetical protein [Sphingomonadales bacterium]
MAERLGALRRPRLLIRAARFGQVDYSRNRDLRRLLQLPTAPGPEAALQALLLAEEDLETARRQGMAGYNLIRHIEVLIAMMAEARHLPRLAQGA